METEVVFVVVVRSKEGETARVFGPFEDIHAAERWCDCDGARWGEYYELDPMIMSDIGGSRSLMTRRKAEVNDWDFPK